MLASVPGGSGGGLLVKQSLTVNDVTSLCFSASGAGDSVVGDRDAGRSGVTWSGAVSVVGTVGAGGVERNATREDPEPPITEPSFLHGVSQAQGD